MDITHINKPEILNQPGKMCSFQTLYVVIKILFMCNSYSLVVLVVFLGTVNAILCGYVGGKCMQGWRHQSGYSGFHLTTFTELFYKMK